MLSDEPGMGQGDAGGSRLSNLKSSAAGGGEQSQSQRGVLVTAPGRAESSANPFCLSPTAGDHSPSESGKDNKKQLVL